MAQLKTFAKPRRYDRNMVVIGGGSAGLVSAYIAAAVKASVTLIEKHRMGGDCLNTGCVPSKALIRTAKLVYQIKNAERYGLKQASVDFDFAQVMDRVQGVIADIEPHDSVERYQGLGVECIKGPAKIVTPFEVSVEGKTFTTRSIVVAAGARPTVPPIPGLESVPYYTSDTLWSLRDLPRRLVVLGGGPIGSELAQCFARLGSSVTQLEALPRILTREDPEVSEVVEGLFRSEGVDVRTGHLATKVVNEAGHKRLVCEHDGKEVAIEFDALLIAVGRTANTNGYGIEELGIPLTPQRTLAVNQYLQTIYPSIYGCGDVVGPYQFTHVSAHQAWFASVNALFGQFKKFKVDYSVIPWCTFTDPEVARVGLNETEAKEQGVDYEVTTFEMAELDRAIADEARSGFVKVLTLPGKDRVLGVTSVGSHAGETIAEYVAAMKHGFGLNKILGTIHSYPTMAEANKYAAGAWKRAHAPQGLLKWLGRYHKWRCG